MAELFESDFSDYRFDRTVDSSFYVRLNKKEEETALANLGSRAVVTGKAVVPKIHLWFSNKEVVHYFLCLG